MPNDTTAAEKPRKFIYNGSELEDIDPGKSEEDIKKEYESVFPELTTAMIKMELKDGYRVYTFAKAAGTKG